MAYISSIIISNILGFLAWFYDRLTMCDPLEVIIAIILGYLAWSYDRGRRYNYLAERWYILMNTNTDCPEFFDPNKTKEYKNFSDLKKTKYNQHARMYWAFVEDIYRNDYAFEKWPFRLSFANLYIKSITDITELHYVWLKNNYTKLYDDPKIRNIIMGDDFDSEIELKKNI